MSEQQRSVLSLNARDIPIKSVTVFTDRAEVNRSFRVSIKPGLNEIRLDNVAGSIEQQSIRVDGKGGAAAIHEVKFESKPLNIENSDLPKVKELTTKLKEVEADAQKERDLQSIYNARIEALNNAVKTIGQSSTKGDSNNLVSFNETAEASLENFFDYHERKSIELKAKTRVVEERIRTLDLEIQRLNDEINQYRWNMGTKNTISIEIENGIEADNVEVELDVSYQVYGARWSPSYDIRVKSKIETHIMDISYFGNIQQQTGEDWTDIELSLSTAQPGLGGDLPKLGTTVVQFYRPPPPAAPVPQMYAMRTCMAMDESAPMGGAARKMKRAVATAEENVLSTTFTIPVRKTIPSDPAEHKVTITVESLTAFLHYHCVPKKDTNVFLLATVVNDTDYPILAGPASVYVNNSMSAMINLKSTSCGEKLECPLGVDKTVKVIYKPTHKFQTQVGMINKNSSAGNEQRIVVKNTKRAESVLITLHEPVPKSSDEKIKVRLFSPDLPKTKETAKTEEDLRIVHLPSVGVELDDLHNLLWTDIIQPEHEKEFIVKWAVEYPHNETVEYVERSEQE